MSDYICQPTTPQTESVIASVHKQVVVVQSHVWKKMHGWCKAANSEVSGLGLVRLTDYGMEVYDVFLPKQKCSAGYTELDDLVKPKLITRLHKTKRRTEDLRFWWHTHYNFNTFWSSIDDNNAREMVEMSKDWLLSIVINQKGDYRCRVDTVKPIRSTIDKITVYIGKDDRNADSRKRNFKTDIKKYVKPMTYAGPNESGSISYVSGRPVTVVDSRFNDGYEGYGSYYESYYGGNNIASQPIDKTQDPYKKVEDSKPSESLDDWWKRYDKRMADKGIKVVKPDWVKTSEEKKISPVLSDFAEQVKESRYQMEDGEEIALDGKAYIYHAGMFLSEEQYLWSLETGRIPDTPEDKNECDEWIKLNSIRGLIS